MANSERKKARDRDYYLRNRTRVIERSAAHQKANKAQKNENNKRWRERHATQMNDAVKDWRIRNPEANMVYGARERAKKLGVECTITKEDIQIPDRCPVFGFILERGNGRKKDNSPSLDRIDNNDGYVPGNIVVVSWLANRLKSNATMDQLKAIVRFYETQTQKASSPDF